jgi:hypothetical protein
MHNDHACYCWDCDQVLEDQDEFYAHANAGHAITSGAPSR